MRAFTPLAWLTLHDASLCALDGGTSCLAVALLVLLSVALLALDRLGNQLNERSAFWGTTTLPSPLDRLLDIATTTLALATTLLVMPELYAMSAPQVHDWITGRYGAAWEDTLMFVYGLLLCGGVFMLIYHLWQTRMCLVVIAVSAFLWRVLLSL